MRIKGHVFEFCDYAKNIEWLSISAYKGGLLLGHATDGLYVIDPDKKKILWKRIGSAEKIQQMSLKP